MKQTENWGYEFFDDLVNRGLVSSSSLWIKKAIKQNPTQLSLAIADSRLLVYDRFDRELINLTKLN